MAITAALLTANSDTTDLSSYASASITPTANALILAAVTNRGAGSEETPTASGNGLTWVEVASAVEGTGVRTTVFRAMGASPSAGAVTFAFGATQTACVWSICEFAGVDTSGTDGSGAVVQSAIANATAATAGTADFTNPFGDAVNNATYSAIAHVDTTNTLVDTGFTELSDTLVATPTNTLQVMWLLGEDQTPAPTWTSSPSEFAQVAIEIKAAGAGAVTGTIATTQENQTAALSGTVANPVTGTVAAAQADQTAAFAGTVTVQITGTIAASQVDQTAIFTGTVADPVTGSIAVTQSDQTMVASGLLTITGTFTVTQDAQTAAFTGIVANPVTGTIGVTQANQTAAFVGFMGDITFWQPNPVAYTRNPVAYVPVGADDDPPW